MTTTLNAPGRVIEDVANQTKEQFETFVRSSQEQARKQFEQTVSSTKEQIEKASEQLARNFDELSSFSKANTDAVVAYGNVIFKGLEDISKEVSDYTRVAFDSSVAAGKRILSASSLREAIDCQADFTRTSFDGFVAEATKLQELSVKIANAAAAPLNARLNAAADSLTKPFFQG
jgi:phasin family protein